MKSWGYYCKKKMDQSSESLDYESAARYRDRIAALRKVLEKQYVSGGVANADIVVAVARADRGCVSVMSIRNGQNLGMRHYFQKTLLDETARGDAHGCIAAVLPQKPDTQRIKSSLQKKRGSKNSQEYFQKKQEKR
ncbi:MAG: hypothetical protein CM1200mP18_20210 [Gammaproteobacteria bacterium]|nr:MAG: hypothetical protein CM1200mP18_20210 [Gammaproteobacteria bacterium]